MPVWTDTEQTLAAQSDYDERPVTEVEGIPLGAPASCRPGSSPALSAGSRANVGPPQSSETPNHTASSLQRSTTPPLRYSPFGWPIPSSISANPEEARAAIQLPEFDDFLLERARVISGRFPLAEAEYRNLRGTAPDAPQLELPHFERVFRIA